MSKEVNEERAPRTVEDVKEMLVKHSNGEIQRTIQNCITILQNDHVLADAIRLNLLSERMMPNKALRFCVKSLFKSSRRICNAHNCSPHFFLARP